MGVRRVFFLTLCVLLTASSPSSQSGVEGQSADGANVARSPNDIATALADTNAQDGSTRSCPSGREDRSSDLCAQWKAADAAASSAIWSKWTVFLGIAGAIIGFLTLLSAAAAAYFAKRAADHTADSVAEARRSAQAAEDSLAETRRAFAIQLRPYVYFTPDPLGEPEKPIIRGERYPFTIKNFGQTPALNLRIQVNSDTVTRPIGAYEVELIADPECYGALAPGASIHDHLIMDLTAEELGEIAAGRVLITRQRITYDLPTGGSDGHEITYVMTSENLKTGTFYLISQRERERLE